MKRFVLGIVAGLSLASTAHAATNITPQLDLGWYYGQVNAINQPQVGAPYDLTVAAGTEDTFSLTDGFIPGDTYAVITKIGGVTITGTSTFTTYATPFVNNLGPAAYFSADWTNNSYAHYQDLLSAGSYMITIKDTSSCCGYPAGFGYRVDAVPEPATWAMMLAGFAALGFASFRRTRSTKSTFASA